VTVRLFLPAAGFLRATFFFVDGLDRKFFFFAGLRTAFGADFFLAGLLLRAVAFFAFFVVIFFYWAWPQSSTTRSRENHNFL
jgi:hypothetical protein